MNNIQIEMAFSAIVLLIIILLSLTKSRMSVRISIAWLLLPLVFLLISIFPDPLTILAHTLGFETLANFIFLATIALLIVLCFSLTVSISRQQEQITKLAQELSILKHKNK